MIKKWDNFAKIRFGCRIVFVTACLIAATLLLRLCSEIMTNNGEKVQRSFESHYRTVESKLDGFNNISEALFYNSDVQKFCEELNGGNNTYNSVPVSKTIALFEKFFNEGQYRIILTTLNYEDVCVDGKGTMHLSQIYDTLLLNDERMKKVKSIAANDKLHFYDRGKGLVSFVFSHQYTQADTKVYCFVIADINALLPAENFIITDEYGALENTPHILNTQKGNIIKRESLIFKGLVYEYNAKQDGITLFAFLVACLVLCAVSIIFNKKISEKILNITYMPLIKVTGTADMDNAKQKTIGWDVSARKLIHNSEILLSTIKESTSFQKKTYLKNLLYNIEENPKKHLEKFSLTYLDTKCRAVLIDFTDEIDYAITREIILQCDLEKNIERLLSQNLQGELVAINELRYVYITSITNDEELMESLVKVLNFTEESGAKIFICIGKPVEGIANISTSFGDAINANEKQRATSSSSIVFSNISEQTVSNFNYPIDLEIQIIDNVLNGNKAVVGETLNNLLNENMYNLTLDDDKMRELKIVLLGTINRVINRMSKNIGDVFDDASSVYLKLAADSTREEFIKNVKTIFYELCVYNENRKAEGRDKLANEIITFIEKNFGDSEMSLEKTAKEFYVSENHISRVLKNKTGKSYKAYLIDIRIKEAKNLLRNTPLTVSDIAEKVGYTDLRAFNKLFKKYTGNTPGEYRNIS